MNKSMDFNQNQGSILLSELLSIISPSLEWIFGREQSNTLTIRWVAVYPEPIEAGDLYLIEGDPDAGDRVWDAAAAGAAAVGIVGGVEPGKILCTSLPIFQIRGGTDLRSFHRLLLQSFLSQKALALEQGSQIQTRLTQIAAHGEGLPGLVSAMRDMTQHSILIQDRRLAPLASGPTSPLRPFWEDLVSQLSDFPSMPEGLRDPRQASGAPSAVQESLPGGLERVIAPILVDDAARGWLSIIAMRGELDVTDHRVAEQGALVCAVELVRAKAVRDTEKRLHGDLLSALLHQNLTARDARLWAQSTGLDLEQQHAALRMAWDGSGPTLRRLETIVNAEISRQKMRTIVSSMSGEVVCFCETTHSTGRPIEALALAQAVIGRAGEEHPDGNLRCGVGSPAPDLSRWSVSFRQAGQALDMARRLDERKPLFYMDLSVYRLLLQIEDHPELGAFLQETLGPILNHEKSAELLNTLDEYFAHNGNLSQTSDALFIHRNTLTYRMDRIAEISGLDLDNSETRLAAQLALRVYKMLSVIRQNE